METQSELWPSEPPRGKSETIPLDELPEDTFTKAPTWMVESVRKRGVVVPIIVLDMGDDGYVVKDGRRRVAAARRCKFTSISAKVYDANDWAVPEALSVLLNEERSPNDVVEFDDVIAMIEKGYEPEQIARATGLNVPKVEGYMNLASCVRKDILDAMRKGQVKFSTVRQISKLMSESQSQLVEALKRDGVIVAKLVRDLIRVECAREQTGTLFADDELSAWKGRALATLDILLDSAPTSGTKLTIELAQSAIKEAALEPTPFEAHQPVAQELN